MLGIVYDAALHGTHIRELARHGLIAVSPIAAKTKGKDPAERVEKRGRYAIKSHPIADGGECVHTFDHHGGQICEVDSDSSGEHLLRSLGDPFIETRSKADGTWTVYVRYTVRCNRHRTTTGDVYDFDLRSSITAEDDPGDKFNVAENVRAVPPRGPKYSTVYGWRQSIENDNAQSDSRKHLRRGRSSTAERNLINEIGWAIMVNGVARLTQRANRAADSPPTTALAA